METAPTRWRMMMHAEKLTAFKANESIRIEYGTVHDVSEDKYFIQTCAGVFTASRAFSCVIRPESGDRVIYSRDEYSHCCILSIIERPTGTDASVSFPGNVNIHANNGSVTIAGDQGLQLASAKSLNMVAGDLNVAAGKGTVNVADILAIANQFTGNISKIRIFADTIDSVAERLSQKLRNSFRMIEGVDHTRAGEVLTTVRNLFSLRSRQAAMLAKKDMKIDAERIHMG
jgi:hypothetical protein